MLYLLGQWIQLSTILLLKVGLLFIVMAICAVLLADFIGNVSLDFGIEKDAVVRSLSNDVLKKRNAIVKSLDSIRRDPVVQEELSRNLSHSVSQRIDRISQEGGLGLHTFVFSNDCQLVGEIGFLKRNKLNGICNRVAKTGLSWVVAGDSGFLVGQEQLQNLNREVFKIFVLARFDAGWLDSIQGKKTFDFSRAGSFHLVTDGTRIPNTHELVVRIGRSRSGLSIDITNSELRWVALSRLEGISKFAHEAKYLVLAVLLFLAMMRLVTERKYFQKIGAKEFEGSAGAEAKTRWKRPFDVMIADIRKKSAKIIALTKVIEEIRSEKSNAIEQVDVHRMENEVLNNKLGKFEQKEDRLRVVFQNLKNLFDDVESLQQLRLPSVVGSDSQIEEFLMVIKRWTEGSRKGPRKFVRSMMELEGENPNLTLLEEDLAKLKSGAATLFKQACDRSNNLSRLTIEVQKIEPKLKSVTQQLAECCGLDRPDLLNHNFGDEFGGDGIPVSKTKTSGPPKYIEFHPN